MPGIRARGRTWGTESFQAVLTEILCRLTTSVVNDGFIWCFTQQGTYCQEQGGKGTTLPNFFGWFNAGLTYVLDFF